MKILSKYQREKKKEEKQEQEKEEKGEFLSPRTSVNIS